MPVTALALAWPGPVEFLVIFILLGVPIVVLAIVALTLRRKRERSDAKKLRDQ